jgi:hypothetical protein
MRISPGFFRAGVALAIVVPPQLTELSLGRPNASIADPFSEVAGLAELGDGRAVVSDRIERTYSMVDFRTGERRTIGRNGIGPTEYQVPFGPIRWRGDTLLGYDPNNRRLLKLTSDGSFVGAFQFPAPSVGGVNGWAPPRGVDAAGRIYWDTPIIEMQPTVKRSMKAQIVRWLPGSAAVEPWMQFNDHGQFEHEFRYRPMPQTDAWVLAPDGRLGVLSASEYRLRWYKDGALVETGPAIGFDPVRLTSAERDAFRERKALEPAAGASMAGAPGSSRPTLGQERARAAWPDSIFPAVMPPFEEKGVLLAPGGDLWVRRTGSVRERAARVDVLDAHGALRGVVRLPPRTRLLSLGVDWVYVASTDDDGLQTLQRYAYPAALRSR